MKVSTNATRLARQVLAGEVWPPLADRHAYRAGPDGQPFLLPGMGGVTLDVHCGDPATGYASDHLEPGASIRHRDPGANLALQFLTCVDNQVRVVSGPAAGAAGHVIGQHAYVLADFADLTGTGTGTQPWTARPTGSTGTAAPTCRPGTAGSCSAWPSAIRSWRWTPITPRPEPAWSTRTRPPGTRWPPMPVRGRQARAHVRSGK